MNLLGDVNDGWFAKLAHGVEDVGRGVGNFFTGGSGGDTFYNNMGNQANQVVSNINQNAINQATAAGATPHQALNAGSAAMDRLTNPQNASDLLNLTGAGAQTAGNTVADTVGNLMPSPDLGGLMMGALAVGGTLLACEMFSSSPSTPASSRNERERECY